ncbi:MAG: cell wall hydrolase [Lachnospiraceae bacterium]
MFYRNGDSKQEEDYGAKEDEYLFADGMVDTMQEKTLMRNANKNYVRKRLTNASKGIGVGDEIEVDGKKIEFVDQTIIDGDQIKISYGDYEIMQRIVEAEATGLDEKSKILVANVLFNRVRSPEFPNTIEEVVFQEVNGVVQFQPISDGRYETVEIKDDTVDAVNKAILGVDYSKGALYFLARSGSRKSSITWFDQNLTWLFEYEGHEFYK